MALPPTSFLTGLAVWLGLATGKPCKGVISLRWVASPSHHSHAPAWFLYTAPTALVLFHSSSSGVAAISSLTGLVVQL
ncbi:MULTISPECIES: hypothetical protein [unclassified Imperialibacter]|nr:MULTISPECIES: hypothetical protein [unclassified Imperialibacter]